MSKFIYALVEGQTESGFVTQVLAPHWAIRGWTIQPVLPGKRGGVPSWPAACKEIQRLLQSGYYCTTMFDFYGMPMDWPGRQEASKCSWQKRAAHVQNQMLLEIQQKMGSGFNPQQFIPYVQLHEFEALVFADVGKLTRVVVSTADKNAKTLQAQFQKIVRQAEGQPEAINDGYETCPSRRIKAIVPGYAKIAHGVVVAQKIGIMRLRQACPHFNDWICRLEALTQSPPCH